MEHRGLRIHLGGDHAGFELKKRAYDFLKRKEGIEVVDHGPFEYDQNDDYPDYLHPLAAVLSDQPDDRALIFGGSGMGESIVLNRYTQVRCGVWYGGDLSIVSNYREHDNINALAFAARFMDISMLEQVIECFLDTEFSPVEKYKRRVSKIDSIVGAG